MKTNRSNVIIIMNCIVIPSSSNNENKLVTENPWQSTLHRRWHIQTLGNPLNKQRREVYQILYRYLNQLILQSNKQWSSIIRFGSFTNPIDTFFKFPKSYYFKDKYYFPFCIQGRQKLWTWPPKAAHILFWLFWKASLKN